MRHKASPIFFEGQKIVRLSDLPSTQSHLFGGWIRRGSYVILGEKNDFDCVRYEDYEYWYLNYFLADEDFNELL